MHRNAISRITALAGYAAISCLALGSNNALAAELLKARLAQNLAPISALAIVAKSRGSSKSTGWISRFPISPPANSVSTP